ncbi:MAG: glycosyltransferase [Bacillota bacterium]
MLFLILLITIMLLTAITVYNYFTAPRLCDGKENKAKVSIEKDPFISILIPARDEESNIKDCIDSVLNQSYKNYELIILDDHSSDRTYEIAESYCRDNNIISLYKGDLLPQSWTGKNWACFQLAHRSKGEYLLFLDSDVRLSKEAVRSAINLLYSHGASLLSVFPKLLCNSQGERLLVPLVNWFLLTFLPLKTVFTSKHHSVSAASGQFILLRRDLYFKTGGHKAVASKIVEDMELARHFKKLGYRVLAVLGGDMVLCRMYYSLSSAFSGFTKNFYAGFDTPAFVFLLFLLGTEIIFLLPLFLMFFNPIYIICAILIFTGRIIISLTNQSGIINNLLLHPFQMIMFFVIGINSVYARHTKRTLWRGRKY